MAVSQKSSFKDILESNRLVLIDFHADWCGPCKMMKPILSDLKQQVGDKVRIVKIDIDKNEQLAQKYQIRGVPTLLLFRNGRKVWEQRGVVSAEALKQVIDKQ